MHPNQLRAKLAEPFDPSEVKWKAQVVRGSRALTVAYVDARCVEDRLDDVFGPGGWQTSFELLAGGSVSCTLEVRIGDEWVRRVDVGSPSEQPDEGDRMKAAFSDALKRAAVQLGIGRYIYRLPQQWCEYDAQTRQIKGKPKLPDWALPRANSEGAPGPVAPRPGGVKPAGATISRKQWEDLKGEIGARKLSQAKVLAFYQVGRPSEFPAEHYADALRRVQSGFAGFQPDPAPAPAPVPGPPPAPEDDADVETPIE